MRRTVPRPASKDSRHPMWRFRHLIVLLSVAAVGYYFSFMFQADWKILAVLGTLFVVIYVAASMADPIRPDPAPKAEGAADPPPPPSSSTTP